MKHGLTTEYRRVRAARETRPVEGRTLALILGCYACWTAGGMLYAVSPLLAITVIALTVALHSSLQHEAIHRHPTRRAGWNEALVFLPLGLLVPFRRYRALHLMHHQDARLTDPYDDPESYYLALADYRRLPRAIRTLLDWNNRLAVRVAIGPAISATGFLLSEARALARARGDNARQRWSAWGAHIVGLALVAAIVRLGFGMPVLAYAAAAYAGLSLLAIRSFVEHRWAEASDERTVIVERSLLGLLFLNNNLHLVHHKHPGLPWYALPAAYRARRDEWCAINRGYVFQGYRAVWRAYALRPKEPVAHPGRLDR